ncbi:MAG TPA: hypothetical protein VGG62_12220 [Terracidiphilus sp.]|jgi:hypothetical protein
MIHNGDWVTVYPHGKPEQSAVGIVSLISSNQRSIAVDFADKPPFISIREGALIGPDGIMMLAFREAVGPWVEMLHGGHYEIEETDGPAD